MKLLRSIGTAHKKIDTNRRPIIITCNDFKEYVCKYTSQTPANYLFNEYIVYCFLNEFKILVPEFVFIDVSKEHIPDEYLCSVLQYRNFNITCIGTKFLENSKHFDNTLFSNTDFLKRIVNLTDLHLIALCDIWLCNEDRNHNNTNLLLNTENKQYKIYAIDHENCFNSNSLENELELISENESIINTEFYVNIFNKNKSLQTDIKKIIDIFEKITEICNNNLDLYFSHLPDNWQINKAFKKQLLQDKIFNSDWKKQVINTFTYYLRTLLKNN